MLEGFHAVFIQIQRVYRESGGETSALQLRDWVERDICPFNSFNPLAVRCIAALYAYSRETDSVQRHLVCRYKPHHYRVHRG